MKTTYKLVVSTDGVTTEEHDVTNAVAGLIGAVVGYYQSWIAEMVEHNLSADDALEHWTEKYGRAECEEQGYDAAQAFVEAIGFVLPDPHAREEV